MTQKEMKEKYGHLKPIGVCPDSNWGGLEILAIENGTDDYVVCRWNYGTPEDKLHRVKIDYKGTDPRIRVDGCNINFNSIMRT